MLMYTQKFYATNYPIPDLDVYGINPYTSRYTTKIVSHNTGFYAIRKSGGIYSNSSAATKNTTYRNYRNAVWLDKNFLGALLKLNIIDTNQYHAQIDAIKNTEKERRINDARNSIRDAIYEMGSKDALEYMKNAIKILNEEGIKKLIKE